MEAVFCEHCEADREIIKERERTKTAMLDCGHTVTWDDDSGTWKSS